MATPRTTTSGSVRKRRWLTSTGEAREAWLANYVHEAATLDGVTRHRRQETFATRRAAVERLAAIRSEIAGGRHVPQSTSITVAEAARTWLERCEADGLERSSIRSYRQIVRDHLLPRIGTVRIAALTSPVVERFAARLTQDRGAALARRVLTAFKSILSLAQRLGLAATNAAQPVKIRRQARHEERLAIPTPEAVAALLGASTGREKALVAVLALAGLRASEARALEWSAVDLEARTLTVRRRADRWCDIGSPKSAAGRRSIPMSPMLVTALKEWRLASGQREGVVFPTSNGTPMYHSALVRSVQAAQRRAGVPVVNIHAYRHYAISAWIAAGFGPKKIMTMAGHSSITMTYNVYGHLFASGEDDHDRLAAAELRLVGSTAA